MIILRSNLDKLLDTIVLLMGEELALRGTELVLIDQQIELAQALAVQINATDGKALAVKGDVASFSAIERIIQDTVKRTGRLDYLFNNAGIMIGGDMRYHTIEDWKQIIDVNLYGVVHGVQAAYPIMVRQGFGHIVNTASVCGLMAGPRTVSYAMTKHAVVGLSTSLRAEAAAKGVRVSVLCPGVVRTPLIEGGGKFGKVLEDISLEQQREMWEVLKPMAPDIFARQALDAVARNKAIIIVPAWWKLFWMTHRLSPALSIFLAQKAFQNSQKELGFE